jgi:hypothetical protein
MISSRAIVFTRKGSIADASHALPCFSGSFFVIVHISYTFEKIKEKVQSNQ